MVHIYSLKVLFVFVGRILQIKPLLLNTYLRMKALYGMSCAELPVDIARRFQLVIRFHQQHEKVVRFHEQKADFVGLLPGIVTLPSTQEEAMVISDYHIGVT